MPAPSALPPTPSVRVSALAPITPSRRQSLNPHSAKPTRGFVQSGFNEVRDTARHRSHARGPHRTLQIERKPQDRSVRRAEERSHRARKMGVRGLIHPTPRVSATSDAARSKKACSTGTIRRSCRRTAAHLGNVGFMVFKGEAYGHLIVRLDEQDDSMNWAL